MLEKKYYFKISIIICQYQNKCQTNTPLKMYSVLLSWKFVKIILHEGSLKCLFNAIFESYVTTENKHWLRSPHQNNIYIKISFTEFNFLYKQLPLCNSTALDEALDENAAGAEAAFAQAHDAVIFAA